MFGKIKNFFFVLILLILLALVIYAYVNIADYQDVEQINQTLNLDDVKDKTTLSQGKFTEIDFIHKAQGTARIEEINNQKLLKFDPDFKVTQGPDLFIYLSKNKNVKEQGLGNYVSLGEIKSFQGEQIYDLPENYQEYKSVVIWCRAFGVLFSYAEIE